jgi:hypothetical protein
MDRLLMVIGGFSLVLVVLVLGAVRREHIRVEYSVSWLMAATVLMIVSFNRRLVEWMAHALEIAYPPLVVLALMFGVFLVVLYRLSLRISELKDNNIALAQKLAILEYRHNSLHEEHRTKNETQ